MTKTMLDSRLLDLLTDAQKQPYLFELLKTPITAAQADPTLAWLIDNDWYDARWLDLEDDRIIDQLPSGTFEVDRRNGVIWVYPA